MLVGKWLSINQIPWPLPVSFCFAQPRVSLSLKDRLCSLFFDASLASLLRSRYTFTIDCVFSFFFFFLFGEHNEKFRDNWKNFLVSNFDVFVWEQSSFDRNGIYCHFTECRWILTKFLWNNKSINQQWVDFTYLLYFLCFRFTTLCEITSRYLLIRRTFVNFCQKQTESSNLMIKLLNERKILIVIITRSFCNTTRKIASSASRQSIPGV